ncbi:MAG: hypothetical protein JO192_11115 [Candidatus Eremiobacteraeota bacterium]|nr:hypothetical protein [Candidatus Eremiobacteraeota bacterium]
MKPTGLLLTIFAAICIAVAGCSGGSTPGIPSTGSGTAAGPATRLGTDSVGACHTKHCLAKLVVPLTFNGHTFSIAHYASCKSVTLEPRHYYTAPATKHFWLKRTITLDASCVPNSAASRLFIGVAEIGTAHRNASQVDVDAGTTKLPFTPLGRMANVRGTSWQFSPVGFGIKLNAHAKYAFFVISSPVAALPVSASGNYLLLQPLSYDGSTFSVVPNTCFDGDPEDAPPYAAPTSGPLTLSGTVSITPTCVPSPLPSNVPLPQLFIVAVDVSQDGWWGGGDAHQVVRRTGMVVRPSDFWFGEPSVAIAGPVNVTDNPWAFAPVTPGLTMTSGASYAFFIAAALPPAPPPTQSFREVVPLTFDGTTFTIPTIASCASPPPALPYAAPTTAPLTLTSAVSETPTCVPTSSSSSSSSSGSGQLYIVAVPGGCSSSSSSSNSGNGCCSSTGGNGGDGQGGSSSNCGSSGSGGDTSMRAHDGWNSCNGNGGGDAKHQRDWGDGGACTIDGYAIAGPAAVSANPWSFAPLSPALTLNGGQNYTFYIGVGNNEGDGGGDH